MARDNWILTAKGDAVALKKDVIRVDEVEAIEALMGEADDRDIDVAVEFGLIVYASGNMSVPDVGWSEECPDEDYRNTIHHWLRHYGYIE